MGRSVAAQEVYGHSRQGDADADKRVDGVAVEWHEHQEEGQEAENDGVEETELRKEERHHNQMCNLSEPPIFQTERF